jgi:membrane-bound lytic murein transglycosylase A
MALVPVHPSELHGWPDDDLEAARIAFQRQARIMLERPAPPDILPQFAGQPEDWQAVARRSLIVEPARHFFEDAFTFCRVADPLRPQGLFTGYFEPAVSGSLLKTDGFQVPLLRRPDDLVQFNADERRRSGLAYGRYVHGVPAPYHTRRAIEEGALDGQGLELCWLQSWEDAFFIHIQGSARVSLPDGQVLRLTYAAKSGRPYTAIGAQLVANRHLTPATVSMQSIRNWLADHPREARAVMWNNESYIFFRKADGLDDRLGAIGAGKAQLTPGRSIAIDKSHFAYGTPVWLETTLPSATSPTPDAFHHLLIAQDTGSAITGLARGDIFCGWGETAAHQAGHMKQPGNMVVLLPHAVAARLGLSP